MEKNRTVRFSTHCSARARAAVQLKSDNVYAIWFVINKRKKNRFQLMYASVDVCTFWLPSTLQQQRNNKTKKTLDKPFTLIQCECRMLEYEQPFIPSSIVMIVRAHM